jgi:hypothetical protein
MGSDVNEDLSYMIEDLGVSVARGELHRAEILDGSSADWREDNTDGRLRGTSKEMTAGTIA